MNLCMASKRQFTGLYTAEPDSTCLLAAGHDGGHDWTPNPIVADVAHIRYQLDGDPTLEPNYDPPPWVGFTVNLTEPTT